MKEEKVSILSIADYLIKYSSETTPVSVNDIAEYIYCKTTYIEEMDSNESEQPFDEQEFQYYYNSLPVHDITYEKEKKSLITNIRRNIGEWIDKKMIGDFVISTCLEHENAVDQDNTLKFKSNHKVIYIKRPLNEVNINILRNAIETFTYSDSETTGEIIEKLNNLTPIYNRVTFDSEMPSVQRRPDTEYYKNLRIINTAFRNVKSNRKDIQLNADESAFEVTSLKEGKMIREEYENDRKKQVNKISFIYCEYDENKQLVEKPLRNGSLIRKVNPVKIMWSNGYYYLVASFSNRKRNSDDNSYTFINYRIDRMKNVKVIEDEFADTLFWFDAEEYREKHPVMYVKKMIKSIEILCDKSLINNALDTFGFGIEILKTSKPDMVKIVIRNCSHTGVKMWALEYSDKCEILAPQNLRNEMRAAAEHLMSVYGQSM